MNNKIEQVVLNHAKSLDLTEYDHQEMAWDELLKGEEFSRLKERGQELESLKISFPSSLSIEFFSSFPNLSLLHIEEHGCLSDDWPILKLLKNLKSLTVEHAYDMGEEFFQSVADLPNLVSLELIDCEYILDQYLRYLTPHKKLTTLIFHDSPGSVFLENKFTESCFKHLPPEITFLEVIRCFEITDNGLSYLTDLKSLQGLRLRGNFTDRGFSFLCELKNLQKLDLGSCKEVTETGFKKLGLLKNLQDLTLSDTNHMTDESFNILGTLPLKKLKLDHCTSVSDKGYQAIKALNELEHLELEWSEIKNLKSFVTLSKMESLNLTGNWLPDDQIKHLASLNSLKSLNLSYNREIRDQGIEALSKLPKLHFLDLSFCSNITKKGFQALSSFKELTHLDLSGLENLEDEDLKALSHLPHLTWLNLENCHQISDAGLKALSSLKNLSYLNLRVEKVTAKGLLHLVGLQNLERLRLKRYKTQFRDEDMDLLPFKNSIKYF